jgi:hypothetical protein
MATRNNSCDFNEFQAIAENYRAHLNSQSVLVVYVACHMSATETLFVFMFHLKCVSHAYHCLTIVINLFDKFAILSVTGVNKHEQTNGFRESNL